MLKTRNKSCKIWTEHHGNVNPNKETNIYSTSSWICYQGISLIDSSRSYTTPYGGQNTGIQVIWSIHTYSQPSAHQPTAKYRTCQTSIERDFVMSSTSRAYSMNVMYHSFAATLCSEIMTIKILLHCLSKRQYFTQTSEWIILKGQRTVSCSFYKLHVKEI